MLDPQRLGSVDHYLNHELSVAMCETLHNELSTHFRSHLADEHGQEDLAFALWQPSHGTERTTAILKDVIWPRENDRHLQGNASFTSDYVQRVLRESHGECGIALIHSHLGPGWQGMSRDDVIAERDRLAGAVFGRTGLPLLGMTWGTDEAWSARLWVRQSPNMFVRRNASTVRVIGHRLRVTFNPDMLPAPRQLDSQVATVSVWGADAQATLARIHIGIVGLGSVGSIVAEALSRIGVSRITLIDHDLLETRNLDRTLGAVPEDVDAALSKVDIAERTIRSTHTSQHLTLTKCQERLQSNEGYARALDCDVLFSCVDRPTPRHYLNGLAYAHLIPVVDGGIRAEVRETGELTHVTWRIHTVGAERACLICLKTLTRSEISMDLSGKMDEPTYVRGLKDSGQSITPRENVFPFSLSVAAHEVLQMIALVTGSQRIGGRGPQTYHGYPGEMKVEMISTCQPDCAYAALTATAQRIIPDSQKERKNA